MGTCWKNAKMFIREFEYLSGLKASKCEASLPKPELIVDIKPGNNIKEKAKMKKE